jgi:hypothetical protein
MAKKMLNFAYKVSLLYTKGSSTRRKCTKWDRRPNFYLKEFVQQIFIALKNSIVLGRV